MNSKETGKLGEEIASNYLQKKGYQILDRNFQRKVSRFLKSELDIVAKRDNTICFIEVKTLRDSEFLPEEKVDFKKKKRLAKTAESWLMKKKIPLDSKWQIDIVSVKIDSQLKKAKISHFRDAVS